MLLLEAAMNIRHKQTSPSLPFSSALHLFYTCTKKIKTSKTKFKSWRRSSGEIPPAGEKIRLGKAQNKKTQQNVWGE